MRVNSARSSHLRRVLLIICILAAAWAVLMALTDGFIVYLGPIRVSSRNPDNPIVVALLSALSVWALSPGPGGRRALREDLLWLKGAVRKYPRLLGVAPALTIALVSMVLDARYWAAGPPLWLDEEMIAINVRDRSLAELAGPLWLGQSAPLGWLAVERAALLTLGTGERALRLVPLLFGIGTVVAAVWIGRRWLSPVGAAVFVLLCAFGQWLAHFRFEVKHYTADAFWGLLLPVLAIWVIEAARSTDRTRRAAIWWGAAAVGHWFANGALLVIPACAVFLLTILWRRNGARAATMFALFGLVWLASFALHYELSIGPTHKNEFLRTYWVHELPPPSIGLTGTVWWLVDRLEPLANNPAGTSLWVSLWLGAIGGFAFSSRPALGWILATIPLSAFAFAAVGLLPLYERFTLWVVPAIYLSVALLIDRTMQVGWDAYLRRQWTRLGLAAIVSLILFYLCADTFTRGKEGVQSGRPRDHKHLLDDRAAVRWLIGQRQPGDAVMTTRLAWPAVWWYGPIPIAAEDSGNARPPDGRATYEVAYEAGSDCRQQQLRAALKDHDRVLVYLGFRDVPAGFDDLVLDRFADLGAITAYREFSPLSRAAVIDLRDPALRDAASFLLARTAPAKPMRLEGCIAVQPMHRW